MKKNTSISIQDDGKSLRSRDFCVHGSGLLRFVGTRNLPHYLTKCYLIFYSGNFYTPCTYKFKSREVRILSMKAVAWPIAYGYSFQIFFSQILFLSLIGGDWGMFRWDLGMIGMKELHRDVGMRRRGRELGCSIPAYIVCSFPLHASKIRCIKKIPTVFLACFLENWILIKFGRVLTENLFLGVHYTVVSVC